LSSVSSSSQKSVELRVELRGSETRRQASHASVEQASMLALGPGTSIRDEFELEVPDVFFADGGWGCEKTAGSTTEVV